MIDYISGGEYLVVTSNRGAQPYINKNSGQPMIGAVSYDPNSLGMKVYDGSSWMTVGGGTATINLSGNLHNDWGFLGLSFASLYFCIVLICL